MSRKSFAITVCGLLAALAFGHDAQADGSKGNQQIHSIYPIRASVQRSGDGANMIVLFSYKRMQTGYVGNADRPQAFYFNSTRSSIEFDCRDHRSRIVRTIFFSDRMGRGNVVHQHDVPGGWMHDDDHGRKDSLSFIACRSPLDPH